MHGLAERVERLLVEVSAFFERSTGWWEVREADRSAGNAWAVAEAGYQARITALIRAALEPLGDDPIAVAVIDAVLVHVYFSIRAGGGSAREAVDVERQLLVPWLEADRGPGGLTVGSGPELPVRATIGAWSARRPGRTMTRRRTRPAISMIPPATASRPTSSSSGATRS